MKFLIVLPALFAVTFASLARDVEPVLGAVNPLTAGLGAGLQQGAGNVKAAVQNVGVAANQLADGVGDVAANTVAGLGQTAGQVPLRVYQLVHQLQHGGGPIGALLNALLGS